MNGGTSSEADRNAGREMGSRTSIQNDSIATQAAKSAASAHT